MSLIVLLGRILYALLFILASFSHFSQDMIHYAASHAVLFPSFLVPASGILALLGGISILIGYKARLGAWFIVIFLIPVTFMMHRFWSVIDPAAAEIEKIMFMKNLALLGTALILSYFGSGPLSIDRKSR